MKKVFIIFLTVAFSVVTFGQIVNLSGNWTLDATKSKLNEQFSLAPKLIKVNQSDSLLILEKKLEFQGQEMTVNEKFNLDGSECSNPGFMESVKISKVTFSEDNKTIKISSKITTNDGSEIVSLEQYFMDNEGLTYQSTSSSSFFGEMSETAVYNKN
jgi:hypothetical protein